MGWYIYIYKVASGSEEQDEKIFSDFIILLYKSNQILLPVISKFTNPALQKEWDLQSNRVRISSQTLVCHILRKTGCRANRYCRMNNKYCWLLLLFDRTKVCLQLF